MFLRAVRCQWPNSQFGQFGAYSTDARQVSADEGSVPCYPISFQCDLGQVADLSVLHFPQIKPEAIISTCLHGEH